MRRVTVENAQLGMILARAVYDGSGTLVLETGTVLDARHIPVLPRLGVREVIVQDSRVDDVIIVPLISEETEAQAIRMLHRLIDSNHGLPLEHVKLDISSIDRVVKNMVQSYYTVFMGEINAEGCYSPGNFDYIHPVKVTGLAILIGKQIGLEKSELVSLGIASLIQNIGYIGISQNILSILDPTNEDKNVDFRQHVEYGAQLLRPIPIPQPGRVCNGLPSRPCTSICLAKACNHDSCIAGTGSKLCTSDAGTASAANWKRRGHQLFGADTNAAFLYGTFVSACHFVDDDGIYPDRACAVAVAAGFGHAISPP